MNKPVAWRIKNKNGEWLYYDEELVGTEPLYAHPVKEAKYGITTKWDGITTYHETTEPIGKAQDERK